ncbi:MerR family transcriptional regulator [Streptomyces bohaiensis]|uniref:MerR family transcriptional regulator n=1 Tax=Streptomyces bohaiensis TaxID=1431344 RepID=A0ABX1CED4_9ACTN|nr:MerR family transcriptional regulator [Streptomyces bohaiensis]NJQ15549.1 MerR family transcriptional regulator [Streptomyces bohaiensis]
MRIGELAGRTGVSVRSLRYYEDQGLLASGRSGGGQRTYDEEHVERVRFIQHLYAAGISSRTIAELLPCVERPSEENSGTAQARLAEERDKLARHIADLSRTLDSLDSLIASTADGTCNHHLPEGAPAADPARPTPVAAG